MELANWVLEEKPEKKDALKFAEFLKKAAQKNGWNQTELAKRVGENRSEIGRYLKMARWSDGVKLFIKSNREYLTNTTLIKAARDYKEESSSFQYLKEKVNTAKRREKITLHEGVDQVKSLPHQKRRSIQFVTKPKKHAESRENHSPEFYIELIGSFLFSFSITIYLCYEQYLYYSIQETENTALFLSVLGESLVWFLAFLSAKKGLEKICKVSLFLLMAYLLLVCSSKVLLDQLKTYENETTANSQYNRISIKINNTKESIRSANIKIEKLQQEIISKENQRELEKEKLPDNFLSRRNDIHLLYQKDIDFLKSIISREYKSKSSHEELLSELEKKSIHSSGNSELQFNLKLLKYLYPLFVAFFMRTGLMFLNCFLANQFSKLIRSLK